MDLREVPVSVQGRHPWETTRAEFFTSLIVHELSRERPLEVADIGSGDAYLAEHLRRYSRSGLLRVLEAAGLTPLLAGGLFASLLVPRALSKMVELARGHLAVPCRGEPEAQVVTGVGSWLWGALPTRVIAGALRLDAELCLAAARRSVLIPGLSVWALAEQR